MPRPTDRIGLKFPALDQHGNAVDGEWRVRWWWICQPPPSVAFALQGRVAAAVGDAAGAFLQAFFADPDQAEDFEAERRLLGEELALRTLRRARAGKALFAHGDGDAAGCTDRLWAVLRFAQAKSVGSLDAITLLGEPERTPKRMEHRWTSPSLLHRVLLASMLRFDGEGDKPREALADGPPRAPEPPARGDKAGALAYVEARRRYEEDVGRAAMRDATIDGSLSAFVTAFDQGACSPDEVALLSAWAVLHLWRPF